MAYKTEVADAAVNAAVDALCALANGGNLRIYDGAQPTNADTAVGAQVLLAELALNATAFAAAIAGVATANAITADSSANATGTATWFRVVRSAGSGGGTVFDGTVGTSGCNLNLNSVAIQSGAQVSVTSLTFTIGKENTAG